ncbi:MAG TPA: hypothetical protein DCZ72_11105, partial [Armatimonadetes bacterium]|nr:hypothetical protein [Armatimonadota bacterium]
MGLCGWALVYRARGGVHYSKHPIIGAWSIPMRKRAFTLIELLVVIA